MPARQQAAAHRWIPACAGMTWEDWGLQDWLLVVWFCWSGYGSRIVRRFCFVKCDAGEIDDCRLLIEDWVGVTGARGDSRLRGNDVGGIGDCRLSIVDWGLGGNDVDVGICVRGVGGGLVYWEVRGGCGWV